MFFSSFVLLSARKDTMTIKASDECLLEQLSGDFFFNHLRTLDPSIKSDTYVLSKYVIK